MTKIQNSKHGFRKLEFRILSQRGVSLYLAVMIMAILLSIAFGVSSIFIGQLKTIKAMGNSVVAFYAADTGIEQVLLNRANPSDILETVMANGATYQVIVAIGGAGDCLAVSYCVKSIGKYKETRRAIEISY